MTKYSLAQLTVLKASPPELIRLAGEAGYDYVGLRLLEVTGGDAWPLASDPVLMRKTKDAISAHGVGVLDVELVRLTPDVEVDGLRATFDTAAELGAKHVLTQAHDTDWSRLVENFGRLSDLLAGYPMTADVEFLTWTAMSGVNEVARLLKAVSRPNVGITIDTLHFFRSGCEIADIRELPPHLFHFVQIADAPAAGPADVEGLIFAARENRLEPGAGELDLKGVLRALPQEVAIAIEIPNTKLAARFSTGERVRRALEGAKAVVAEAHATGSSTP